MDISMDSRCDLDEISNAIYTLNCLKRSYLTLINRDLTNRLKIVKEYKMRWIKYLTNSVLVFSLFLLNISCDKDGKHEGKIIRPSDIDGYSELTKVQTKPEESHIKIFNENYSIKLNWSKTEFVDAINIKIPYDANISDNIFGLYYNSDSKRYEPVDYSINTTENQIKFVTHHL